jgi:hypothetical protein
MKRFLDDLDENQGWVEENFKTGLKFLGSTALAVTSIIPTVWGIGSSLINLDAKNLFDNSLFDAWETMQTGLDKSTVVYGGSDIYNFNPETGEFEQKGFLSRFASDPIKSANADIIPAASFIAGAVLTELLATAAAPFTGGSSVVANTARLAAQGARIFSKAAKSTNLVSKSMKAIRGLDTGIDVGRGLTAAQKIRLQSQVKNISDGFRSTLGTVWSGYRSAAYESALIARSTQERTLNDILIRYHKDNGGEVDMNGFPVGEMIKPTEEEMLEFEELAAQAGEMVYMHNVPLVAGSNFFQIPKLFIKSYGLSKTGAGLFSNYKFSGTRVLPNGQKIANVDANKYFRTLGYTSAIIKQPIVEGFEEFAQGAMEEGFVDYYSSNYNNQSMMSYFDLLNATSKKAKMYLGTQEGQDSVTIGALMGLLGMRLPFKMQDGKAKFSAKAMIPFSKEDAFGGSMQAYRDLKKKANEARKRAATSFTDQENEVLANNFKNSITQMRTQENMDDAAAIKDTNEYKNQEHQQLFSLVHNRYKNGLIDGLVQDIEAAGKIPLDEFNKTYAVKGQEYTEEQRRDVIKKTLKRVDQSVKSIQDVENVISDNDEFKYLSEKGLTKEEIQELRGLKEQMMYLNAVSTNSQERIAGLTNKILEETDNTFPVSALDFIEAKPKGVRYTTKEGETEANIEFSDNTAKAKQEIMSQYKRRDEISYNKNAKKIEKLVDDVIKLKLRDARAAAMYNGLFTKKGSDLFREYSREIQNKFNEEFIKHAAERLKKEAEEAKTAGQANKAKVNADSLGPEVSGKVAEVIDDKIVGSTSKLQDLKGKENINEYENFIRKELAKNPHLFNKAKELAIEKGIPLVGINNMEDLNIEDMDGSLEAGLLNAVKEIVDNYKPKASKITRNIFDTVELNDQLDLNNKEAIEMAVDEDSQTFFQDLAVSTEETDNNIFINTYDKQLEKVEGTDKFKNKRDSKGKLLDHPAKEDLNLDTDKINSPDFLNNSIIQKKGVAFELRVAKDNEFNQQETTTPYNMVVEVFYKDPATGEETKIGQLPEFKEGGKEKLKTLREEVFRRFRRQEFFGEVTNVEEYKERKKEVTKQLQELQKEKSELLKVLGQQTQQDSEVTSKQLKQKVFETNNSKNIKTKLSKALDNIQEIANSLGSPIVDVISSGGMGVAFLLNNGKVLKLTSDFKELKMAQQNKTSQSKGFVKVDSVNMIDSEAGVIILEKVTTLSNQEQEWFNKRAQLFYPQGSLKIVRSYNEFMDEILMYENMSNQKAKDYVEKYSYLNDDGTIPDSWNDNWERNKLSQDEKAFWSRLSKENYEDLSNLFSKYDLNTAEFRGDQIGFNSDNQLVAFDLTEEISGTEANAWVKDNVENIPTIDIDAKKADIERRREEELNNKQKFVSSEKRQEKEGGEYKTIAVEDINLEESGLEGIPSDAKVIVLEERGLNSDGKKEGTVRIITKGGTITAEVFFNLDKINAKYDAELAALEGQTVEEQVESTIEIDKAIEDLKAELEDLNIKIKGTAPTFEYKQSVETVDDGFTLAFNKYSNAKSDRGKKAAREELIEKYGEKRVARYEAIDSNFNDIVKEIIASGINIFSDSEEGIKLQRCK